MVQRAFGFNVNPVNLSETFQPKIDLNANSVEFVAKIVTLRTSSLPCVWYFYSNSKAQGTSGCER